MITKRDQDIYNFIEDFHAATASQLHALFFNNTSYRYSRKRLQYLSEEGFIKRTRSTINNDYAYYIKKYSLLQQLHHDLIRTELYTHLKQRYYLLEWNNEMTIANIRPDALTYINDHGIVFPVFVEIHLNNKFNFDKYKELIKNNDLRAMFGIMPRVVICTDRQVTVPNIGIKFKVVGLDMSGLDSIFK
jgi:hypothetical protein